MMPGGDRHQPVHIHRMPVEIDGDDTDCSRRDGSLDLVEVHDIRVIHIDEHRPGAEMDQRFYCGKGGVAGHNDLVASPNPLKLVQ